jgi:hypothetical protein
MSGLKVSTYFNAASNEEKRREEEKQNETIRREVLRQIGKMQGGVEFFNWIFENGMLNDECFTGNSHTFFYLGVRKVPQMIAEELKRADMATYAACENKRFENDNDKRQLGTSNT